MENLISFMELSYGVGLFCSPSHIVSGSSYIQKSTNMLTLVFLMWLLREWVLIVQFTASVFGLDKFCISFLSAFKDGLSTF